MEEVKKVGNKGSNKEEAYKQNNQQNNKQTNKQNNNDIHPYNDIIHLPHHVSSSRAHMSILDRAAQFSPFAALTGFEGAIKETARLTDQKIELDEAEKTILDEKLRIIQEQLNKQQLSKQAQIELLCFQPDEYKAGGEYISMRGIVKKIERYERALIMQDGTRILIEEIVDITGEMFQKVEDSFA